MSLCDVAIIGAGPYGLSLAAHLKALGVSFRIFGRPMEFWLNHMPKGMHLKSEGFASSLYDPSTRFTLGQYCKEHSLQYADIGAPVPLDVFSSYGLEFQRRLVPEVENKKVVSLKRSERDFRIELEDGEIAYARRVVIAVGLTYFAHVPQDLANLPAAVLTHSSQHVDTSGFKGREVAIIGAGSSAIDLAALLHQAGAHVRVIARTNKVRFHDPPDNLNPSWFDQMLQPVTGIGPGWKLFLCTNFPLVFRRMPASFRLEKVRRILGPAPCWFTREQVEGKVTFNLGVSVSSAKLKDSRAVLELTDEQGRKSEITADHVIAATGYKPDLSRLTFMDQAIAGQIRCVGNTPVLSSNFESSEPNVYFVGITAANTFGPLLRFAYGAKFAAPRLARHLARSRSAEANKVLDEARSEHDLSQKAVHS